MFSLINFVKSAFVNEASPTNWTVQQTTPLMRCEARAAATAIVTRVLVPGRTVQVKFQGSWWTAQCQSGAMLSTGDVVQVMHRQNLTLYVEPLSRLTISLQQTVLSSY